MDLSGEFSFDRGFIRAYLCFNYFIASILQLFVESGTKFLRFFVVKFSIFSIIYLFMFSKIF